MKKTRVMVVDDQNLARMYFELIIKTSSNYRLAASVGSADYAETVLLRNSVDLIIMDIYMADGSSGLDAAARIKKRYPGIKIIAVTSMPEVSWIEKAREAKVDSFWYKESSADDILEICDRTMQGESVYPDNTPVVRIGSAESTEFTDRELDVLRIMTDGKTNLQIARILGISENTVKNHIRHMMEKTGCDNRTELAIKARVMGIVLTS